MPAITVLDSTIYNRIAAGEVVERPASVVKELVENSIDAGATEISVEISQGGSRSIRVTDNGCGMARDDLRTAFLPHATSKIRSVDDLDSIATLGFRGEALASIAAVAMVTVKSRTAAEETGWELQIKGGVYGGQATECALNVGTQFLVENLFFNAPARAKFLKSARSEEGEISDLISRFILSHPEIRFVYRVNEKEVYRSAGVDLYAAVYTVYGDQAVGNLLSVSADDGAGMRVEGYVGKPEYCKANRTYQTLFVNGRYVTNAAISGTVQNAYTSYTVKRQYPFFVLNITLPLDLVDVNVHPNKKEVRFQDAKHVCGVVYHAVVAALSASINAQTVFQQGPGWDGAAGASRGEGSGLQQGAAKTDQIQPGLALEKTGQIWRQNEERNRPSMPSRSKREEFHAAFRYENASNSENHQNSDANLSETDAKAVNHAAGRSDGSAGQCAGNTGENAEKTCEKAGISTACEGDGAKTESAVGALIERVRSQGVNYPNAANQAVADGGAGDSYLGKVLEAYRENSKILTQNPGENGPVAGTLRAQISEKQAKMGENPLKESAAACEIATESTQNGSQNASNPHQNLMDSTEISNAQGSLDGYGTALEGNSCYTVAEQPGEACYTVAREEQQSLLTPADERPVFRFCGQVFSTYLIVEYGEEVLVIDQHAAHERLLYDRFLAEFERSDIAVQPLMMPYLINVNRREYNLVEEYFEDLEAIGFEVSGLSDCIKVSAVPLCLTDIDLKEYFDEILAESGRGRNVLDRRAVKEGLMQKACKAAVKAGNRLSEGEVSKLLEGLNSDMELRCPHGRPILLRYTRREIEKKFSRIV